MIKEENFQRGGKGKKATVGLTAEGKTRCFIEEVEPHPLGQNIRRFPVKLVIKFDDSEGVGEAVSIETIWKESLITNSGKPFPSKEGENERSMWSNAHDRALFFQAFKNVLYSMANGEVRSLQGHNTQPLFDGSGNRIPDTAYDTTQPPTNNYPTHKADGTPI